MSTDIDLSDYQTRRASLIDEDRSLRREFISSRLRSAKEIEADKIVRKIRALEAETIWQQDYPSIPHPFPGMEFLTGKSIIMRTKIFEILSKMPKGALLHAHLDATVNAEFLLELALKQPGIHLRVNKPFVASPLSENLPEFRILPETQFSNLLSLADVSYTPGSWISLQNARKSFPTHLGGQDGFDSWVVGSMTINPAEATFLTSTGLIRVEPIFSEYIREFFRSSIRDGISYIEARINFLFKNMYGADGQENIPHREWLVMFDRIMNETKAEMEAQGRPDDFIGARIIYSTIRFITSEELEWYLEDCIALKKEFPHLIAGFDLVGHEDSLHPLIYYIKPLLRFRERQREEGVDIPFIFHAGETLGDGTQADINLYDAILLGTKRIGHGYSLIKHPKLMETCRLMGIAVEVCPISGCGQRLTSSMPMHPLPVLLNTGVPVALCSDDPAVFGNMGLTFDYYQVLVASEITGLSTLGALARDSIEFSTLGEEEKKRALAGFERRWETFVGDIVE
ncbi:hypothetical protein M413DRAFT_15077 [Hebeloma cylindrosporum]|uniref:adenosine deaminase n=1 Tax=Hebeloma cylindrosporum TaxID=76867 RepID=A0A0C3CX86_HEBCY|nr:hypothetical protein M413DRAFT_15077 [Hebeloma cylindrosporum h7]